MKFHRAGGGGGMASSTMSSRTSSSSKRQRTSQCTSHARASFTLHVCVHWAPVCDHGSSGQVPSRRRPSPASYSRVPLLSFLVSHSCLLAINHRATVFIISHFTRRPICRAKTSSNLLPPNLDPNLPCSLI